MLRLVKGLAPLTVIATIVWFEPLNAETRFNCGVVDHRLSGLKPFEAALAQTIGADAISINLIDQVPKPSSLWWAKEQFDPFAGNLIEHWQANHGQKQIDLVVDWQLWSLLDYLERYRMVNHFGTVTREYGYSLRVFNQDRKCLAMYHYNFTAEPHRWEIYFNPQVQNPSMQMPVSY